MPKLEYLEVDSNTQSCENFFKSVSKCRRLKYLNVDYLVYDPDLEPLPRSCPELRFLHLFSSDGVTGEGLQAVSALPLEEVTLDGRRYQLEITDDEVVDFARSCPSLEFDNYVMEQEQNIEYENFKRLRGVSFFSCHLPDHFIGQIVASTALETLEIVFDRYKRNEWSSGQFMTNIKSTNLKCFVFKYRHYYNSIKPKIGHFLSVADRFSELSKFVLETDDDDFAENFYLLLENMPKLEYLEVDSNTQSCENFFKSVSKCRHLKYLNVDYFVYDPDLEPLPRSCPELRFLHLFSSHGVTGEGLQAVSALPLEEVTLDGRRYQLEITDDEVVDFARSCPSLEVLKVNAAFELTVGVVARAAVARRESGALGPLRLNLVGTHIQEQQDALGSYEELILDFSDE